MKAADLPVGSVVAGKQSVWIKWLGLPQFDHAWRGLEHWITNRDMDHRLAEGRVVVLRLGRSSSEVERLEAQVAELTRQRDDARDIAVRSGYFQDIKGCDYGDDDPDAEAVAIVARIMRTESDMDVAAHRAVPRKPTPEDLEAARQIVQDWGHK